MVDVVKEGHSPREAEDGSIIGPGERKRLHDKQAERQRIQELMKPAPVRPHPSAEFELPRGVPPSIDGRVFASKHDHDPIILEVRETMNRDRAAAEKALAAASAALGNEMLTLPARHKQAADLSERVLTDAFKRHDATFAKLCAEIEKLESDTVAPKPKSDVQSALEMTRICTGLLQQPLGERRTIVMRAIKSGNDGVLAAVLNNPAFVTGLTETELESIRVEWQRIRHPAAMERLEELRRVREHFGRAGQLLLSFKFRLYAPAVVEAGQRSEQAARQAAEAAGVSI